MLNYDLYPYKAEMEADASTELRIQQNTKRKVSMMQGELITNIREDILGVGCRDRKSVVSIKTDSTALHRPRILATPALKAF